MSIINQSVQVRQSLLEALLTSGKLLDLSQMGGRGLVTTAPAIDAALDQLAQALEDAGVQEPLPDGTAKVIDGASTTVTGGGKSAPASVAVSGTSLDSVALTNPLQAISTNDDAAYIYDRNDVNLLPVGAKARVVDGVMKGIYFSSLTQSTLTDGTPYNLTTARAGSTVAGRARVYVAANVVQSFYLDATAALQTGATVPVQNSAGLSIGAGTVTVTNNLVSAAKLPANITAFRDGLSHSVQDAAGVTSSAICAISNGTFQSQTLVDTAALTLDQSAVTLDGKVYTFTVSGGKVTAIAVADAAGQ